ncbi:dynein, light chain, LC8-type 2a [Sebastes umbrosus]|uniref:dynein, light chain, LC8-type 2a n=1 Tax=Sebastes umbrosus TaxID=72105 RepID=UPI0018A00D18|nr:dynein, light chain, LC8-type 2a [Sebastes umbrosus]
MLIVEIFKKQLAAASSKTLKPPLGWEKYIFYWKGVFSFGSKKKASSSSSTMTDRKAVIKNADMSEDMQQDAVDCATQAMEKYNIEKDIAAYIKKEFDKKYNPTWHCIVGRNFGSYVTHETKHFIYFYLGQVAILLFKSG